MPTSFDQPLNPNTDVTVAMLVADFASHDGLKRKSARLSLVKIGDPAVGALINALQSKYTTIRWEAAKALGTINNPVAAPALVDAMNDNDFGVRWLAAEGIITLRRQGVIPLLQALEAHPDAAWLWESAHHVFKILADEGMTDLLTPILDALEHPVSADTIPHAARFLLEQLL